jgi:hypothetical protein
MTAFPILRALRVSDYGLYPGTRSQPGIDVEFHPGLTLVLGANGLGKTTLITLLYRMCTGPYDIPGLSSGGELGGRRREARRLTRRAASLFADRVNDGATGASATLRFSLSELELEVTRSLESLEMTDLRLGGKAVAADEAEYHQVICSRAGVNTFGDWILLLRHLTFYFEERRALVWDPTAQRQILRLLFLRPEVSSKWTAMERDILERDSRTRNLQSALTSAERSVAEVEEVAGDADSVREELTTLERLQKIDEPKLSALNDGLAQLEANRQAARLNVLQAEEDKESAYRDLERRQLLAIEASFPTADETARYLLAQLISDEECLACGTKSPTLASDLRKRVDAHRCVICGSPIVEEAKSASGSRAITNANKKLKKTATHAEVAAAARDTAELEFNGALEEIQQLTTAVSERRARIEALVKRLPPDEAAIHEQHDEVAALRSQVERMKGDLEDRRSKFRNLVQRTSRTIVTYRDEVQKQFAAYAEGFLLEECSLAWAPHTDRVGETGATIKFPAYELEMAGADFESPVRRSGPEQVSESQREFIDLAFRMALMRVAGDHGFGSLVIDAPESSLDAVFVSRAADVLARFATADSENRLIVTSNLIEGNLIPELIRRSKIKSTRDKRFVDLLRLAAPTAATRSLKTEYSQVRDGLFEKGRRKKR